MSKLRLSVFAALLLLCVSPSKVSAQNCIFDVAGGDCADGCHCWSLTAYCTEVNCVTSGGYCGDGEVTVSWTMDLTSTPAY